MHVAQHLFNAAERVSREAGMCVVHTHPSFHCLETNSNRLSLRDRHTYIQIERGLQPSFFRECVVTRLSIIQLALVPNSVTSSNTPVI
mmetsp:Transcript_31294/g.52762  ORF Transcript_31294/g.52762 Transcript_31294/m.52762 type:complete len:88 (+) Transcript_31294:365-628(+)